MKEDYIKSQFATHKISKQLKELGFNERCFGCWEDNTEYGIPFIVGYDLDTPEYYNLKENCVAAPLWQQVIDWLDSEFGLLVVVVHDKKFGYQWKIITNKNKVVYDCAVTYQRLCDAREIAILKCIEII